MSEGYSGYRKWLRFTKTISYLWYLLCQIAGFAFGWQIANAYQKKPVNYTLLSIASIITIISVILLIKRLKDARRAQ